ncbi:MAG: hypothetical protein JWO58_2296 [Chitinophagaceae bacterium]|nr:hypothetical protein [Chitinophagaceae bacterium]
MKKIVLMLSCAAMISFVACEKKGDEAKVSQKELRDYVDSVKKNEAEYNDEHWMKVEEGYQLRLVKAEAATMHDEEEKKKVEASKEEFNTYKEKYHDEAQKKKDEEVFAKKQAFRDALFGEGKIGADISFSWVTAANIKDVYVNFVNVVDKNKDTYSREDWDEVKVLYEALDTRKNEVEKELSSKDNMTIAKEKVRFVAIKAVNRPMSKVEENHEAKEMDKK